MTIAIRFVALAIGITLASPLPAMGQAGDPARGSAFAQANCATCHAVGAQGDSPYAPAPPFRTLHERYPVENLAEAMAEGLVVQHQGPRQMPEFTLNPESIDDLLAYLQSLE